MLKKIILSAAFFALPLISVADELQLNDRAPETYIVEEGDTLWDISSLFLEQPWLWPQLWRLNPEISNPHLIYPGDVLKLVYNDQGEPQLVVEEPVVEEIIKEAYEPPVEIVREKPTKKMSPEARKDLKENPISTLPLHVIAPYIQYDSLLTQEQIDDAPYVIGNEHGYKSGITNFKIYVTDNLELAKSYAIYQKGEQVLDPETELPLGYSMKLTGTAQAVRLGDMDNKRPGTLLVSSSTREIRAGNIVLPINQGQMYPSFFTMQKADDSVKGQIIKSSSGGREFGKLEVVMINRGSEHMVKEGDVLSLLRKSPGVVETINGPQYTSDASRWSRMSAQEGSAYDMPEEPFGQMMVFKVYEKASMALILTSSQPARLLDSVASPE
ncbi:LysM peptidoglycan-binding domain-containing protein [Thalassotalea atypica]|uniref:LysM peptidoglycan-binding domain-containing protein n=1 Tax=Thalassotalea atypica TaxID=2054316 RepID=UPI002573C97A|nr:LysM domain-containing protein [Thalassotalea atypica]